MFKKVILALALILAYSFDAKAQMPANAFTETEEPDAVAETLIKERRKLSDSINAAIINQPEEELKEFVRNVEAYKKRMGQSDGNTANVDVKDKAQMRKYIKDAINMPETAISPERLNAITEQPASTEPEKYNSRAAKLLN